MWLLMSAKARLLTANTKTIELSGDNQLQLLIPEGFLHGFATLEDDTIFAYKVNNYYNKECEVGVKWNDPIHLPLIGK